MTSSTAPKTLPVPDAGGTGKRRAFQPENVPLVMLVDDTEDARALCAMALEAAGLRVDHAVDGDHALLKILAALPDLVVMDLEMPVCDGWAATRALRTNPRTRHVPIIVLTGHATQEALQRAADAGADAVLTKPCTPELLLSEVRRLLGTLPGAQ